MKKSFILSFILFLFSCSPNNDTIEIVYEINEMNDYSLEVTFTINNSTKMNFDSKWSLHWNQQSAIIDNDSLPPNLKYQYVAGQSYNILSFGKGFTLNTGESVSVDLKQSGVVKRKSDLPVGGFVVIDNQFIDVKFINLWQNAMGIERLDIPSSVDRYNNYLSSTVNKSELDLIVPTPNTIKLLGGELPLKSKYSITIDESLNLDSNLIVSLLDEVTEIDIKKNDSINDIYVDYVDDLNEESYILNINQDKILISASDRAGALYAIQSLKQIFLVSKLENTPIKNLIVNDSPRFSYRGMLLDISRNFYGPEKIKQIIDYLSFFKINHLDFRITDDEGWRLEIPGLEELTEVGSKRAYTKDEFENLIPMYGSGPDTDSSGSGYLSRVEFIDILKYANQRNITIIPQISFPSHARSAIISMNARYQKYMKLGNIVEAEKYLLIDPEDKSEYYSAQGFNDNIACICRESAYTFYDKVIDEVIK